ncbi:unnamed protein product [Heterosigma akashiwo]
MGSTLGRASSSSLKMSTQSLIQDFLQADKFAVVGASDKRNKFGNKILRCYQQHGLSVTPVNPIKKEIEGLEVAKTLADVPDISPDIGVSIITSPAITEEVLEQAAALGVRRLWLQPGAESSAVLAKAQALGLELLCGGPCLLVELGYDDSYTHDGSAHQAGPW